MYVELHAASAFSFLEGASVPEEMAAVCLEKGLPAMALLDRDGLYGSPRFHYGMKKAGLKAHLGSEITFSPYGSSSVIDDCRLTIDGCKPRFGRNHQSAIGNRQVVRACHYSLRTAPGIRISVN